MVIAGVGGTLTIAVVALAFAGAALALTGAPIARSILITAALGGLVTAMPLWIPAGVVIGVAALILDQAADRHDQSTNASEPAAHELRNYPQPQARRGLIRVLGNRWLPLAFTTGAALALWALAAANGYAWQLIWLPAAVAGAAWPRHRTRTLDNCLRRLRRERERRE